MKIIFLTALLSLFSWGSKAQKPIKVETYLNKQQDSQMISQLLNDLYFKGIYEGNVELLSTIYHPGTLLFGDVKGQPYAKTLEEYLDGVRNRVSPKDSGKPFKGEVLSVKTVNSIGYAEVRVTMYDFVYQEFLSFHKIDGKWLLVNKMISDIAGQSNSKEAYVKTSVIATMVILPGFENEIKEALNTMTIESNKEAGCEQFVVTFEKNNPRKVFVYEVYRNDEAFEEHKNLSHSKVFFEQVKGKIADDKIDVTYLTQ